jgi:oxalate decarboxylase/phosphoglucose isomerase-like protein (cupin superfamily)
VLLIADPAHGRRLDVELTTDRPMTVYVPAGLAHAVANVGEETVICVAWAEREHDPADVFPYRLEPPVRVEV